VSCRRRRLTLTRDYAIIIIIKLCVYYIEELVHRRLDCQERWFGFGAKETGDHYNMILYYRRRLRDSKSSVDAHDDWKNK